MKFFFLVLSSHDNDELHIESYRNESVLINLAGPQNTTTELLDNIENICGANFCPGVVAAANPNLKQPPVSKIHLIAGIYLVCMILASLIVAVGVDSLNR